MPLLMCPNDNATMQTIERDGVQFDMCPACRGVWLDRGELETLIGAVREGVPAVATEPRRTTFRTTEDHRHGGYRDDDDRYGKPYRKKRGFDMFDIFD